MFDIIRVSKKIKAARRNKNMTQMDLADAMGVSYQAVSNWERGSSMPDISKILDLCKLLEVSFEELVGEDLKETKTMKRIMEDKNAIVSMKELVDVAPIIQPKAVDEVAMNNINSMNDVDISTLVGLAPYLDEETLDSLSTKVVKYNSDELVAIAPFISKNTLNKILQSYDGDVDEIILPLAPFVDKETLDSLAENVVKYDITKLVGLAPFLSENTFNKIIKSFDGELDKYIVELAPYLPEEILDGYIDNFLSNENCNVLKIVGLLYFLSKRSMQKVWNYAIKNCNPNILITLTSFMPKKGKK